MQDDGGANSIMVPPEQTTVFNEDFAECGNETGVNSPGETYDAAFALKQYERTSLFRDCLLENGINPPELPTYQRYEEDLLGGGVIFDLASLSGLAASDPLREICADPLITWGRE
ncbi:hypothetical protein [Microcella putealis]|uniref:hypothetical protein n=1 Tax=Microcella putealis TaxID=337005 RepID=UPI00102CC86D|nr:hypothetical protein [Microcella putealis]